MELGTAVALVVVLIAAVMQGMTGLGFALVSIPVLMLFEDARTVVITVLMLSTFLNALILVQARHEVSLRSAGLITIGSLLGVPIGSYLLRVLSAETLQVAVAVLALVFSVPLLKGYTTKLSHPRFVSLVTGTVSGALQGSIGMGGPPVALLMASQGTVKQGFRGTLVLRSMAASSLSVLALVPSGMIDATIAYNTLLMVPAVLAGFLIGNWMLGMVSQSSFKRVTVLVVAGTALVSLVGALL